jgi:serine/threonine protein phosphatase PrpC
MGRAPEDWIAAPKPQVASVRLTPQFRGVTPSLRSAALSDIGKIRRDNQDRCLHDPALGLFGVADGVGGMPGGGEAAETAAETIRALLGGLRPEVRPDLRAIVQQTNDAVILMGHSLSPTYGVATTLTFGCVHHAQLILAHVGDSRCYVWQGRKLQRLTEDHTVENEARLRGEPAPGSRFERSAITRCIGQLPMPGPDVIERPLLPGERYFFCTDGITRLIADSELSTLLGQAGEPAEILQKIIDLTLKRGAPDNASGVLVFVDEV